MSEMLGNILSAAELLRNKGIRYETRSRRWDKTVEMLPSTGQKQYEPNNSWLQNKQIENRLKDCKDLLGVERVERTSQLAAAEWLPQESRARVTRKSGQEWTSFGFEENLQLYLIPEEALLLLELNCLELTWKGVALSIQQAYSILLQSDPSKCSIEEYRVYSQLVRQGYRLQRFCYTDYTGLCYGNRARRSVTLKRRKQIRDTPNAFGITEECTSVDAANESNEKGSAVTTGVPVTLGCDLVAANDFDINESLRSVTTELFNDPQTGNPPCSNVTGRCETAYVSSSSKIQESIDVDGCGASVTKTAVCGNCAKTSSGSEGEKSAAVAIPKIAKKLPSELYDNGAVNLPGPSNADDKENTAEQKRKDSKLQIIADETLLGDIRMISKWPGTRLQRNIKRMPKRITGTFTPAMMDNIFCNSGRTADTTDEVRSLSPSVTVKTDGSRVETDTVVENVDGEKELAPEVIEVSDDEIQEVPRKMSRMEMLNLFPDTATRSYGAAHTSRKYLPCNVWPQKTLSEMTKRKMCNKEKFSNRDMNKISGTQHVSFIADATSKRIPHGAGLTNVKYDSSPGMTIGWPLSSSNVARQISHENMAFSSGGKSMVPCPNGVSSTNRVNESPQPGTCHYRNLVESWIGYRQYRDQTLFRVGGSNNLHYEPGKYVFVESGSYTNVTVAKNVCGNWRYPRPNQIHSQNFWSNLRRHQSRHNSLHFASQAFGVGASYRDVFVDTQTPTADAKILRRATGYNGSSPNLQIHASESSFSIVPNAISWAETKVAWSAERTITIEDEDHTTTANLIIDESDVKFVARLVKPLVGSDNATSLDRVYKHLQIINQASNKNVKRMRERNQFNCKIAYNQYSTGQHFRKANPGAPMYRIAVFRAEDNPLFEAADTVCIEQRSQETPLIWAHVSQASVTFAQLGAVRLSVVSNN